MVGAMAHRLPDAQPNDVAMQIRIPHQLHEQIIQVALLNGRTLSSEVRWVLKQHIAREQEAGSALDRIREQFPDA